LPLFKGIGLTVTAVEHKTAMENTIIFEKLWLRARAIRSTICDNTALVGGAQP